MWSSFRIFFPVSSLSSWLPMTTWTWSGKSDLSWAMRSSTLKEMSLSMRPNWMLWVISWTTKCLFGLLARSAISMSLAMLSLAPCMSPVKMTSPSGGRTTTAPFLSGLSRLSLAAFFMRDLTLARRESFRSLPDWESSLEIGSGTATSGSRSRRILLRILSLRDGRLTSSFGSMVNPEKTLKV